MDMSGGIEGEGGEEWRLDTTWVRQKCGEEPGHDSLDSSRSVSPIHN